MTGLDELFPGADERPGVALPPPPQAEPRGSRRLGILALALGLFAIASQLGAVLTAIVVFLSLLSSLGAGLGPEGLDWVTGYELGSAIISPLLGLAALAVGVLAVRRRHGGRRFAVVGASLGGAAVVFGVVLIVFAVMAATP